MSEKDPKLLPPSDFRGIKDVFPFDLALAGARWRFGGFVRALTILHTHTHNRTISQSHRHSHTLPISSLPVVRRTSMTDSLPSWWDVLPFELQDLVCRHGSAARIQCAWLRYSLYHHARALEWPTVRLSMRARAWRELSAYASIRREWRREPCSWFEMDEKVVDVILEEARHGLWGCETRRRPNR
jgi:hypothetical protein